MTTSRCPRSPCCASISRCPDPHSTSYFSAPKQMLDPGIFYGTNMRPAFRREQLTDVISLVAARLS